MPTHTVQLPNQSFIHLYLIDHDQILYVCDSIDQIVSDRKPQYELIHQVQLQVQRLIAEKDSLIKAVNAGHQEEALDYVEKGRGSETMILIRQRMDQSNRIELELHYNPLAKFAKDHFLIP